MPIPNNPDEETVRRIREILDTNPDAVKLVAAETTRWYPDEGRIPWPRPDLNWRPGPGIHEELLEIERKENIRLTAENTQLRGIVGTILAWFTHRPRSASRIAAFTVVPREWWLEGEALLEAVSLPTLPSQEETDLDEPPTGLINQPNRDA